MVFEACYRFNQYRVLGVRRYAIVDVFAATKRLAHLAIATILLSTQQQAMETIGLRS